MISKIGNRYPAPARGFTLLEALMAISILAVGTVSVLGAYSTSVNAIERAQYNIDAACLLKAVMGGIEEKAIREKGTTPGESSGELASSDDVKIDTTQSDRWQWTEEVRASGLETGKPEKTSGSSEEKKPEETVTTPTETGTTATAAAAETKKAPYSLNEVKLTVVNYERKPSNKFSAVTYMENANAESD